MAKHAKGTGAKYTRGRGPFILRLQETYATKGEALAREAAIKRLNRQQKEELCDQP